MCLVLVMADIDKALLCTENAVDVAVAVSCARVCMCVFVEKCTYVYMCLCVVHIHMRYHQIVHASYLVIKSFTQDVCYSVL